MNPRDIYHGAIDSLQIILKEVFVQLDLCLMSDTSA